MGFRFRPTDQELIGHFLRLKNSVPESSTWPVPEIDLYGEGEPWAIWESFGGPDLIDQDLCFFTRLKKKGSRIVRRIGGSGGTWSQGEPSKLVFATRNEKTNPIGRKTKMRYENKGYPEQHGGWSLDEYSSLDDDCCFVICRLRENKCKRKCHNVDDAQPLRKKAKSATVKDLQAQPEVTANEVTKPNHTDHVVTAVCEYPSNEASSEVTANEVNDVDWLETALLEEDKNTLSHALALPAEPSNEASSLACELFNIPMDDIYLNSDDFNNYIFGDEFLSGGGIHTGTADVSPFSSFLGD